MKFILDSQKLHLPPVDKSFDINVRDIASQEDLGSFVKNMVTKIGAFFGSHAAMAEYIKDNEKVFHDLNPEALVRTVLPKDLTLVGNAAEDINEGLEKLRLGAELDMAEFVGNTLNLVGIKHDRGRISIVDFKSGNWGEGKGKSGLDHPMTYKKTIDEFGWKDGAWTYCERFIKLCKHTDKNQVIKAADRHFTDVKNAMAKGLDRNKAVFAKEVSLDQINQLNVCRNVLLKFYYSQLRAIMKGAFIPEVVKEPKGVHVPDTWTGQ